MSYISFQPKDYFNTKLWTGTGSSNAITGVGFQPDWVWIKNRSATESHRIHDAVRGTNKSISSDTNSSQTTTTQDVMSFDSDGFTLGTETAVNANGQNIVGWNWKANGQGSSNTDGSINTTYTSVNTTSGFSISTYSGTGSDGTIGHGLGVAPKMVIVKSLTSTSYWMVYHASLGNDKEIYLNQANAEGSSTTWNTTTPTSSLISLDGGAGNGVNASGESYVCYAFAEKKGFSKFGSYIGNNDFAGTFVYTGFRPAFVIVTHYLVGSRNGNMLEKKRSSSGGGKSNDKWIYANENEAEANQASNPTDFLSNGFKLRSNAGYTNNGSYIYMAFAEEPLVSSNGIPAVAE